MSQHKKLSQTLTILGKILYCFLSIDTNDSDTIFVIAIYVIQHVFISLVCKVLL